MLKHIGLLLFIPMALFGQSADSTKPATAATYLADIKAELQKTWPDNRTINLVFHGHSVPAGYFKTPAVNTLKAYPYLLLNKLKEQYPTAVINIINTAIGGENAVKGAKRFATEVLVHRPDVLFIDYALNDIRQGLEASKAAWVKMIKAAQAADIKVILLTPSPNLRFDILQEDHNLSKHAEQVRDLSITFGTGLVDSYALFQQQVKGGSNVADFMSQGNHPNEQGHALIAEGLMEYFK